MTYESSGCEGRRKQLAGFSLEQLLHEYGHFIDELFERFPEVALEAARLFERGKRDGCLEVVPHDQVVGFFLVYCPVSTARTAN